MKPVRIGIIGLGRFAAAHARIWAQMKEVEVAAVCDRNPDTFAAFQELFPGTACYTDWKLMIDRERLDAVDVLTPEHLHTDPVLYAMKAGLHAFVEKPLASEPDDAAAMVRASQELGRVLMTGHVLRFDSRMASAKRQVEQGKVGTIRSIYAKRNNGKMYFPLYNRVSPVFILGIHDIDMIHWLMDDEVREVYAVRSASGHATEDMIWSMLRFERGGVCVLENNWLLPGGASSFMDVRMEITGDEGSLIVRDPEGGLEWISGSRTDQVALLGGHEVHGKITGPLAMELAHFIECVQRGTSSDILRPLDAWKAVRVAAAICESAALGRPISLSGAELPI